MHRPALHAGSPASEHKLLLRPCIHAPSVELTGQPLFGFLTGSSPLLPVKVTASLSAPDAYSAQMTAGLVLFAAPFAENDEAVTESLALA